MIPVFNPLIDSEEIQAVTAAIQRGEISGSFGESIKTFEKNFAEYCGAKYGVAVSNGTTALHLAVEAAGIQPGDEVLVSASTNIATALAPYHHGAVAVPVDSENRTWNLDLNLIEKLITPKTKAIIPVHLFGHPVDMDALNVIAKKHNLIVIEDAAEAHGAEVRGKKVGALSDMSCFSFYANKVITTGEGGMVVTNNEEYANKIRLLRNLAFTEPRFLHQVAGYNFRMTGYQAAMGVAQLKKIEFIINKKRTLASNYEKQLKKIAGIQLPAEEAWAKNVYWMYGIVVDPKVFGITRNQLTQHLKNHGIETRTFFCPMNLQPFLMKQPGYRKIECPVAESIWENGLYLPSGYDVTQEQVEFIANTIQAARSP